MALAPRTRSLIWALAALLAGIWSAFQIADESYAGPAAIAGVFAAFILAQYVSSFSAVALGVLIFGNIVGNRGFAQLFITSSLPILPAELVLAITATIYLFRAAALRRNPFKSEALGVALATWIILSAIRLPYDVKNFGLLAVRDFATVYYAAFYFIAQETLDRDSRIWRGLHFSVLYSCLLLSIIYPVYVTFPDFFLNTLVFRGDPLIFYKGDLAGLFLAIGSLLFFLRYDETKNYRWLLLSVVAAGEAAWTTNRASALSLVFAASVLAIMGRPRFLLSLVGASGLATVIVILAVSLSGKSWESTPLFGAYEEIASLADPSGAHSYSGEETSMKGDNNAFRLAWWSVTVKEAIHSNPWLGLGWGYDLATPFEQIYYPEGSDEFTTRSPHSILISIFARGGLLSILSFIAVLFVMAQRTVRAARGPSNSIRYWLVCWMILITASLGVVLEGPMGAVVFWIGLSLANSDRGEVPEMTSSQQEEKDRAQVASALA